MAEVVWTTYAHEELRGIVDYIAANSPVNAERVRLRLIRAPRMLSISSHFGASVPEFDVEHVRELVHRPFRVIYVVRPDDVCRIVAVVDGRRDLLRAFDLEEFERRAIDDAPGD